MRRTVFILAWMSVAAILQSPFHPGACAAQVGQDEGFTEPLKTVMVAASESGVIQEISVREGEKLKRGAVICKLNSQVLEASLEAARVKFNSQGTLDAAQATLDDRQHHLTQMKQLVTQNHASEKEVLQAQLAVALAKANLQTATEKKRAAQMEISVIQAEIQRRYVRAPTHGVVLEIPKQEGESITSHQGHVATIVCLDQLRVRYFLTTDQAIRLKRGDTAHVGFPSTGQEALAVVDFVAPVTDSTSGTVRVELLVDNQQGHYRSGLRCVLNSIRSADDTQIPLSRPTRNQLKSIAD